VEAAADVVVEAAVDHRVERLAGDVPADSSLRALERAQEDVYPVRLGELLAATPAAVVPVGTADGRLCGRVQH
jgi:hypothetical protein